MNPLQTHAPAVFDAYMGMIKSLEASCAVEPKIRELILIGILTVTESLEGLASHVDRAISHGATREEIVTAVISPLPIAGVRCVMRGLTKALERIEARGAVRCASAT